MNTWARIWIVMWLTAAASLAAPLLDEPVATLTLKDGTVLHEARAKGFMTKVVLIKHQGRRPVRRLRIVSRRVSGGIGGQTPGRYGRGAQNEQARREAEAQKRAQAPVLPRAPAAARSVARDPELPNGCRLTFAGSKDNLVTLKIENVSDRIVALHPWQFVARTDAGEMFAGTRWVGLNDEGRIVVTLMNEQLVAPSAAVTLTLMISTGMMDTHIETVLWK